MMRRGLLRLLFHAPETTTIKCMRKFATPVDLGHLMHLNFHELDFFWHHCTHRELL